MIPVMCSDHASVSLAELLDGYVVLAAGQERQVSGIALDSRRVVPGDLFIALAGGRVHGMAHAAEAWQRGAVAVCYEPAAGLAIPGMSPVPLLAVPGLRRLVGPIASRFHGHPSEALAVVGITGTNGKTTCSALLAQALARLGWSSALIGTLGNGEWGRLEAATHTTPDAVSLQALLADYRSRGIRSVAMEVSSHALEQGRVSGVRFKTAVYTNLSHEHLDYHGSMADYAAAKWRLFRDHRLELAVINAEDDYARELLAGGVNAERVVTYGIAHGDVCAQHLELSPAGIAMTITSPWGQVTIDSPLLGRFNAQNLLACAACLLASGHPAEAVAAALGEASAAPGRMECFPSPGAQLVVDYAHTPDALRHVLQALREHLGAHRLWCVFGCGGERDAAKRPVMGRIASELADQVVVTDDNPRHEDAAAIRAQVLAGVDGEALEIADRARAITHAFEHAGTGDIVLVAGKGHETTQQVGDRRLPFSDRELARRLAMQGAS